MSIATTKALHFEQKDLNTIQVLLFGAEFNHNVTVFTVFGLFRW